MATRIDPESATIERIRDELIELKGRHALECGTPNCLWVGGLLAFFAHCVGAGAHDMRQLPRLLVKYDALCPGCGSGRDTKGAA